MGRYLAKVIPPFLQLLLFGWMAGAAHEAFHYLVAQSWGLGGSVTFTWLGSGWYHWA